MPMTPPGDLPQPLLTAGDVLDQVSTGVVVIDRDSALLYANAFAVTLFGFPDDSAHLAGRPLLSLGIEQSDAATVQHMADPVLGGWRPLLPVTGRRGRAYSCGRMPLRCGPPRARSPAS